MRQRLNVARALMADPDVLLLDEPTRAVDPVHADDLRQFIRNELVGRYHKTVVFATNLLEEAWRLCDRVAVVNKGKLVALGPPSSLDAQLRRFFRFQITFDRVDDALLDRARGVSGLTIVKTTTDRNGVTLDVEIESSDRALSDFIGAVNGNGVVMRSLKSIEPQPVDVFRQVTTDTSNDAE